MKTRKRSRKSRKFGQSQRSSKVQDGQNISKYIESCTSCTKEVEALPAPVREAKAWPSFRPKMSSRRQWPSFGANFTYGPGCWQYCRLLNTGHMVQSRLGFVTKPCRTVKAHVSPCLLVFRNIISHSFPIPPHQLNGTQPWDCFQAIRESINTLWTPIFAGPFQVIFKIERVFTCFHQAEKITGHRWAARTLR